MNFTGLFGAITRPFGSGIFTAFEDVRGDDPTPPGVTLLATELSSNFLAESGDNFIIE